MIVSYLNKNNIGENMNSKIVLLITLLFSSTSIINAMLFPKSTEARQAFDEERKKAEDKAAAKKEEHEKAVEIVLYNLYKKPEKYHSK